MNLEFFLECKLFITEMPLWIHPYFTLFYQNVALFSLVMYLMTHKVILAGITVVISLHYITDALLRIFR